MANIVRGEARVLYLSRDPQPELYILYKAGSSAFILVKAPLRVLYDKIQHEERGRVHEANPSAVFYRTARVYSAFTDLLASFAWED